MAPAWVLSAADGPHVGPMHLAISAILLIFSVKIGIHILVRWHLYIEMVPSTHFQYIKSTRISPLQGSYGVPVMLILVNIDLIAGSWDQHGVHLGPTGPRWAPCWPHEPCYLGDPTWAGLHSYPQIMIARLESINPSIIIDCQASWLMGPVGAQVSLYDQILICMWSKFPSTSSVQLWWTCLETLTYHLLMWQCCISDIPVCCGNCVCFLPKLKFRITFSMKYKIQVRQSSYPFLPEASFGLRVLSLPASVCVCVRMCASTPCLSAR